MVTRRAGNVIAFGGLDVGRERFTAEAAEAAEAAEKRLEELRTGNSARLEVRGWNVSAQSFDWGKVGHG